MSKDKHLVISYSRANPPTNGHLLVFNKTKEVADKVGGDHKAILSHSQDAKKNPLSAEQKVKFASKIAPGVHFVAANKELPTIMHHAKDAYEKGYDHLHIVAGSDRIDEYKKLLNKYHGPDSSMPFKGLHFHSAGERDPDADGVTGISGTKMREFASNKDIDSYKKGLPDHVSDKDAREMMHAVRKGMKLEESFNNKLLSLKEFYLNEMSNEKLAKYKKAAGEDARKADDEGDTERANKRFSGIIKATNKQFDNDRKKHKNG